MRILSIAIGMGLLVAACSSSNVDEDQVVSTMSDAEVIDLCNEARAEFPERTIDCGDGLTATIGIAADDCNAMDFITRTGCNATAGEVLDCAAAFDAQTDQEFCTSETAPAGCSAAVLECL